MSRVPLASSTLALLLAACAGGSPRAEVSQPASAPAPAAPAAATVPPPQSAETLAPTETAPGAPAAASPPPPIVAAPVEAAPAPPADAARTAAAAKPVKSSATPDPPAAKAADSAATGPRPAAPLSAAAAASAPAAAAAAPKSAPAAPTLDLKGLEQRLRDTHAIGVFTKLSLKNQVDDLLDQFKTFHKGQVPPTLPQLRQKYEVLLMKVVSLLQDDDPSLANAVSTSREAIWGVLSDPQQFANI